MDLVFQKHLNHEIFMTHPFLCRWRKLQLNWWRMTVKLCCITNHPQIVAWNDNHLFSSWCHGSQIYNGHSWIVCIVSWAKFMHLWAAPTQLGIGLSRMAYDGSIWSVILLKARLSFSTWWLNKVPRKGPKNWHTMHSTGQSTSQGQPRIRGLIIDSSSRWEMQQSHMQRVWIWGSSNNCGHFYTQPHWGSQSTMTAWRHAWLRPGLALSLFLGFSV